MERQTAGSERVLNSVEFSILNDPAPAAITRVAALEVDAAAQQATAATVTISQAELETAGVSATDLLIVFVSGRMTTNGTFSANETMPADLT